MESSFDSPRERAIKRIKAKNDFKTHLVAYLTVNAMLVSVWLFTAASFPYPLSFF
jgi:hypothetical protein